jgi:23S rRNA (adenine2030-N6)-methyltransferase
LARERINARMANHRFGNVGDVFKHLLLADILAIEQPTRYCESHAGSASYPLGQQPPRHADVREFLTVLPMNSLLAGSRYGRLLRQLSSADQGWMYPGSAYIALSELGAHCCYTLADIDDESLDTLRSAAVELGVPEDQVRLRHEDGIDALARFAVDDPALTLAFVDPFRVEARSAQGRTSLDLFWELADHGVRTVLWYPVVQSEQIYQTGAQVTSTQLPADVWTTELILASAAGKQAGLRGCGLATANLSPPAVARAEQLVHALTVALDVRFVIRKPTADEFGPAAWSRQPAAS